MIHGFDLITLLLVYVLFHYLVHASLLLCPIHKSYMMNQKGLSPFRSMTEFFSVVCNGLEKKITCCNESSNFVGVCDELSM